MPHFDWGTWHEEKEFELETKDYLLVAGDIAILLIFTYTIWNNINNDPNISIGMFFAVLVDLIDNVPFWKKKLRKLPVFSQLHVFHKLIHYRLKRNYWFWGIITQLIIIIAAWIVLKRI